MEALSGWLSSDLSLWGLFISSFLAATLLPGGSEAVLFGVLKLHPELFWPALMLGTVGNTLGGMVSFGMGWLLPRTQQLKQLEQAPPPANAKQPSAKEAAHPMQSASFAKNVARVRQYGTPALLLAWAPLIGDALCVAAGWLRLNPLYAALFMLVGKFARYAVIALSA